MRADATERSQAIEHLRAVVEKALETSGRSARQVSIEAVGHDGLIRDLRAGCALSYDRVARLAQTLNLELYIGPPRTAQPEPPVLALDGDEFATVPRVDAEASAGPGALNAGAQVIGALAFRRDWLRARGVDPGKALLVTVTGDSMAPTIAAGDLVLLDRARTEVRPPARRRQPPIYIFDDLDGATRLKRLARLDARTLAMLSDNAADHPPQLLHGADAARIRVHGQVVWWGHTER
jgi:phage repressor protein C with HTH and peptisase S24 domain